MCKGQEIIRARGRYSNETTTLRKHVTKFKHIWKWMIEFHSKSESRGIKMARVNSIHITKLSIYFNFLHAVASWSRHQEGSFSNELIC